MVEGASGVVVGGWVPARQRCLIGPLPHSPPLHHTASPEGEGVVGVRGSGGVVVGGKVPACHGFVIGPVTATPTHTPQTQHPPPWWRGVYGGGWWRGVVESS